MKKLMLSTASLLAALPALAQEATTEAAAVVEAAAPVMDKGDVSWMMISTVLVLFMTIPGLALFYGGLVRSKNMLSILMQTTVVACVMMIVLAMLAAPGTSVLRNVYVINRGYEELAERLNALGATIETFRDI